MKSSGAEIGARLNGPADHASGAQILHWYRSDTNTILLGGWLFMLGCLSFLCLVAGLRGRLADAAGPTSELRRSPWRAPGLLPRWWAAFSALVAVVLVIGPIGWAALIFGMPVWTLGTSLFVLLRAPVRARAAAAPA
jgi:type IV secretory pathway TrbD component